jgi:4-amino-4-deoxy-L-arabinose transferase-like glycosyltransferase
MTATHLYRQVMSIRPVHVAAGAVLIALVFSLVLFPLIAGPLQANLDPDRFGELGTNIALGKGFVYGSGDMTVTSFDRAPVYPLIIAFVRIALHEHYILGLQVFQALLHGLTGLLMYRIGGQFLDHRTALLAQIIHAIHPVMVWYTARVWIETTNTFFTVLVVLMAILLQNGSTARRTVLAGVVIGVAVLTKAVILFLPVLFVVSALVRKQLHTARSLILAVGIAVVIIAPWTVRNYVESGQVVPVHTSLGLNLVLGEAIAEHWIEAPFSTLALWEMGNAVTTDLLAGTGLSPASPDGDATLARCVIGGWLRDPATFIRHVVVNAVTYWYLSESALKSLFLLFIQIPLLVYAVRGAWSTRGRSSAAGLLILAALYFWGVHAVIVGWLRYSVPALPLLILLAAGAFPGGMRKKPEMRRSPVE